MNEGGNCKPIKCQAVEKPWLAKLEKVRKVDKVEYNTLYCPQLGRLMERVPEQTRRRHMQALLLTRGMTLDKSPYLSDLPSHEKKSVSPTSTGGRKMIKQMKKFLFKYMYSIRLHASLT